MRRLWRWLLRLFGIRRIPDVISPLGQEGVEVKGRPRSLSMKQRVASFGRWMTKTANYCLGCGRPLRRQPGQIQWYCSKYCRRTVRAGRRNSRLIKTRHGVSRTFTKQKEEPNGNKKDS